MNVDRIKWMYFCVDKCEVGVNDSIFPDNKRQKELWSCHCFVSKRLLSIVPDFVRPGDSSSSNNNLSTTNQLMARYQTSQTCTSLRRCPHPSMPTSNTNKACPRWTHPTFSWDNLNLVGTQQALAASAKCTIVISRPHWTPFKSLRHPSCSSSLLVVLPAQLRLLVLMFTPRLPCHRWPTGRATYSIKARWQPLAFNNSWSRWRLSLSPSNRWTRRTVWWARVCLHSPPTLS